MQLDVASMKSMAISRDGKLRDTSDTHHGASCRFASFVLSMGSPFRLALVGFCSDGK